MSKEKTPKEYYDFVVSKDAFVYGTIMNELYQRVQFIEHPIYGDEHEVIVAFPDHKVAFDSGFWDCDDMRSETSTDYRPFLDDGKLKLGFEIELTLKSNI